MNRTGRFVLGVVFVLGAVTALHIRLNQGGFASFWRKVAGQAAPVRGELVVGYLPVT
jgi:hypothetical protein